MSTWLHFIGRQYYTERQFLDEARDIGVSRRVSLNALKGMNIGDRVYCAIVRNYEVSPVVLGYFTIDRLSGLSLAAGECLLSKYNAVVVEVGGKTIHRGCGEYITGPSYYVGGASLGDIVSLLEAEQEAAAAAASEPFTIGKPLIQGAWTDIDPVIRLAKVKFRQGFRLFDFEKALADSQASSRRGVSGQYYVFDKPSRAIHNGDDDPPATEVQVLVSYRKFTKEDD